MHITRNEVWVEVTSTHTHVTGLSLLQSLLPPPPPHSKTKHRDFKNLIVTIASSLTKAARRLMLKVTGSSLWLSELGDQTSDQKVMR